MKLYLKENVLSGVERFTVKNEMEEDCYQIHGDRIVVGGKKLHIEDMAGHEVAMVQQKLLSLMPKFFVFRDGRQVAEITKKISMLKAKYVINGPGWEVKGSILDHDYTISENGEVLVRLHKVWLSCGSSFEVDINDKADPVLALAVVLAIDCVQEAKTASARMSVETE